MSFRSPIAFLLLSSSFASQAFADNQKMQPHQWDNYYEKASACFNRGDYQKAETIYIKSLKTQNHSHLAMSFLKLGEIYRMTKRFSDAEYCYKKSVRFEPTIEGYKEYAVFLRERNRIDEAKGIELAAEAAARQKEITFPPDIKDPQK